MGTAYHLSWVARIIFGPSRAAASGRCKHLDQVGYGTNMPLCTRGRDGGGTPGGVLHCSENGCVLLRRAEAAVFVFANAPPEGECAPAEASRAMGFMQCRDGTGQAPISQLKQTVDLFEGLISTDPMCRAATRSCGLGLGLFTGAGCLNSDGLK